MKRRAIQRAFIVLVLVDGIADYHLELTEVHCQHIRFPGWEYSPPIALWLAGPDTPGAVPDPIPWQSDNPDAVRVRVDLAWVGRWAVDLTPFRDEELLFQVPVPHTDKYPPLSLRLCAPAMPPPHSDALTALDFEQRTLW